MFLKVMGSKEIAKGTTAGYKSFVYQIILCAVYTIFVGVISCIAAVVPYAKGRRLPLRPRGTPLPDSPHLMAPRGRYAQAVGYHWGESACFYATEEGCATLYDHIYSGERSPNISLLPRPSLTFSRCSASTSHISSGDNGLGESFVVFAFVAFANTSFVLLKAGCYATLDFDFMAAASLASLILVFTPALLIAIYCFDSSVAALYIAMCAPTPRHTHDTYTWSTHLCQGGHTLLSISPLVPHGRYAPHFALVPCFGARLTYNVRRMLRGEDGPWTTLNAHAAASAKARESMSEGFPPPSTPSGREGAGGPADARPQPQTRGSVAAVEGSMEAAAQEQSRAPAASEVVEERA